MKEKGNKIDRRNLLKAAGAAGLASTVAGATTGFAYTGAVAGTGESSLAEKEQERKLPEHKADKSNDVIHMMIQNKMRKC